MNVCLPIFAFPRLDCTWQGDKSFVRGRSVPFGMSSGQVHESWERCHVDQSSESMNCSLGSLYSAQLLVHLSCTPVMGTRL